MTIPVINAEVFVLYSHVPGTPYVWCEGVFWCEDLAWDYIAQYRGWSIHQDYVYTLVEIRANEIL